MTSLDTTQMAFERTSVVVPMDCLLPLKTMRAGVKSSKKYVQILGSIRAIGLVEAPVVAPVPKQAGRYFLLDGHLRVEALKDLGQAEVECLVSTDDETYTYNKRINRLAAVQEHRMVTRAIQRGVPREKIAAALGIDVASVNRRSKMLNGICAEAVDILKDSQCPMAVFDIIRRMTPMRQIEVTELMMGQNNFTVPFAKALLAATPDKQLAESAKKKTAGPSAGSVEQIARMEKELATLQAQVKSVEDTYGLDNLHLTVARGYIRSLLANAKVVRWLSNHRREYLQELQSIAEIEQIGERRAAAE